MHLLYVFLNLQKKSSITEIDLWGTSMSEKAEEEICNTLKIPIEERNLPIKSNTKSAAKISA